MTQDFTDFHCLSVFILLNLCYPCSKKIQNTDDTRFYRFSLFYLCLSCWICVICVPKK